MEDLLDAPLAGILEAPTYLTCATIRSIAEHLLANWRAACAAFRINPTMDNFRAKTLARQTYSTARRLNRS